MLDKYQKLPTRTSAAPAALVAGTADREAESQERASLTERFTSMIGKFAAGDESATEDAEKVGAAVREQQGEVSQQQLNNGVIGSWHVHGGAGGWCVRMCTGSGAEQGKQHFDTSSILKNFLIESHIRIPAVLGAGLCLCHI